LLPNCSKTTSTIETLRLVIDWHILGETKIGALRSEISAQRLARLLQHKVSVVLQEKRVRTFNSSEVLEIIGEGAGEAVAVLVSV